MKTFMTENSSRIISLSFEGGVLRVEFVRGGIYEYYNVPEDVYETLVQAKSLGNAFDTLVKGKFAYSKII
jgi:hypothetical protein